MVLSEVRATLPLHGRASQVLAGVLAWFAVGAAVGAAALLAEIDGWLAWPLCSFAATVIYLVLTGAQLVLVTDR